MAIISPIVGQGTTTATYQPAMMKFDGSTGYYSNTSVTSSGNLVTLIARIKVDSYSGDSQNYVMSIYGSTGNIRGALQVYSNDFTAEAARRDKLTFQCRNSSGSNICLLLTDVDVCDGEEHMIFAAYDATTGAAQLYVDGVDADDSGWVNRTLTTGTLDVGAGAFWVGAANTTNGKIPGNIGFVGCGDAYLTNYTSFMDGSTPKELDESGWTEWGAQPLFWNEHGDMVNNKGSAGAMTHGGLALSPQDLSGIVVADY